MGTLHNVDSKTKRGLHWPLSTTRRQASLGGVETPSHGVHFFPFLDEHEPKNESQDEEKNVLALLTQYYSKSISKIKQ